MSEAGGAEEKRSEQPWGARKPADKVIASFQPDAKALEEDEMPLLARITLYVIAALLVTAVIWAALSRVDRIVVAQGRLTTDAPTLVVQPLETSIIRSIEVEVGEVVEQGALLARLDPTFADASRTELDEQLEALEAEEARLSAEVSGREFGADGEGDAVRLQREIFLQRKAEYAARMDGYAVAATRLAADLDANAKARDSLEKRLALTREVEQMRAELLKSNAGSRLQLLAAREQRLALEGDLERARAEKIDLEQRVAANTAERQTYAATWAKEAAEALSRARAERNALEQKLVSASRRSSLLELRAEEAGIVLEIAERSVGSVIEQAQTFMTLVPIGGDLKAEVEIPTSDIGWVREGAPVRIKFETLPFQQHGTAKGTLRVVTRDAVLIEQGDRQVAVYKSEVSLDDLTLRRIPEGFAFTAGMQVTAEIKVGTRTILSYLLSPLTKTFDESLKEP